MGLWKRKYGYCPVAVNIIKTVSICAFLVLLSASHLFAQAITPVLSKSGPYQPLGYCQITSLATAKSLVSASCSSGSVPIGATIIEMCVSVQTIRYRDDGVAPTTTLGMPVAPNSSTLPTCFAYAITPLSAMQLIAVTGSPIIDISFYR